MEIGRRMTPQLRRDSLGLGLRAAYYPEIFSDWPDLDYFEAISENFMGPAAFPEAQLNKVLGRYPVVLHGVALNLLGHEPLNEVYLKALKDLADRTSAPFVSDHLCWSGSHGAHHHDLLPFPYRRDLIEWAAERARSVQDFLGRPFGLENLSSYVNFADSEMDEWTFYNAVVKRSGCWYMLDLNNIYVSSRNHGFDPLVYLESIDFTRVLQVHIAGHDASQPGPIIDTHDRPVAEAVWDLYRTAWKRGGPFPTLLEWDDNVPSLSVARAELLRAKGYRS